MCYLKQEHQKYKGLLTKKHEFSFTNKNDSFAQTFYAQALKIYSSN